MLPAGAVIGVINSPNNIVTAYASDDQLSRLAVGMKVFLRLRDSGKDQSGTIVKINPVPSVLPPSPLLSVFGGEIKVQPAPGKNGGYLPEKSMFKVEIVSDAPLACQQGRTLRVLVQNREILFDKFVSSMISFFRREF